MEANRIKTEYMYVNETGQRHSENTGIRGDQGR